MGISRSGESAILVDRSCPGKLAAVLGTDAAGSLEFSL